MSKFIIDVKRYLWFDNEDQVKRETYRWTCPLCHFITGHIIEDPIQIEVRSRVHMIVEHKADYANLKMVISDEPAQPSS